MESSTTHIFVSYSHVDRALITPIVQVLRAVGAGVFQDVDSIPPGKRWRLVIEDSLDKAVVVLVFWCEHSLRSEEVRKEWQRAIRAKKDTVPVLLDNTKLDAELADFQAVDLRSLALSHASVPSSEHGSMVRSPESGGGWVGRLLGRILFFFAGTVVIQRQPERLEADAPTTAAAQLARFLKSRYAVEDDEVQSRTSRWCDS